MDDIRYNKHSVLAKYNRTPFLSLNFAFQQFVHLLYRSGQMPI
jgi:hypothetical protein